MSISNIKGIYRRIAVICDQVMFLKKKTIKEKFLISMYKEIYSYEGIYIYIYRIFFVIYCQK